MYHSDVCFECVVPGCGCVSVGSAGRSTSVVKCPPCQDTLAPVTVMMIKNDNSMTKRKLFFPRTHLNGSAEIK